MAKSKKGKRASDGTRFTPLDKHVREKKILKSPMGRLGNLQFSSWVHEVLANVLWSALIASLLSREKAIATFRVLLTRYKEHRAEIGDIMLEHSQFAQLTHDQFDLLFAELCNDEELKQTHCR